MLLMIDNYDSFTFNLVQYLGELGVDVRVYRNDEISLEQVAELAPERIVISPGPCTPNEAGISVPLIRELRRARAHPGGLPRPPVHRPGLRRQHREGAGGDARQDLTHPSRRAGCLRRLEDALQATRYHSLVIEEASLPECLEITAWTEKRDGSRDEIMGVRHRDYPVQGVQFHPESILTRHGHDLLRNFIEDKDWTAKGPQR